MIPRDAPALRAAFLAAALLGGASGAFAADSPLQASPEAPGATNAASPACQPDADLSGLYEALQALGAEVASDAASALKHSRIERAALCRRLDAERALRAALSERIGFLEEMVALERANRESFRAAWLDAMKDARREGRGRTLGALARWGPVIFIGGYATGEAAGR